MLPPPIEPAEPQRKEGEPAWLPSAGLGLKRATLHVFDRYEVVPADSLKYANGPRSLRSGKALIYKCTETGAERRWGLE